MPCSLCAPARASSSSTTRKKRSCCGPRLVTASSNGNRKLTRMCGSCLDRARRRRQLRASSDARKPPPEVRVEVHRLSFYAVFISLFCYTHVCPHRYTHHYTQVLAQVFHRIRFFRKKCSPVPTFIVIRTDAPYRASVGSSGPAVMRLHEESVPRVLIRLWRRTLREPSVRAGAE